MQNKLKLTLSIIIGVVLFICMIPMQFSRYIPEIHSIISLVLCAVSSLLFSLVLIRLLNKKLLAEGCGAIFFFILLSGAGHAIYTVMFYSSWICLGLSIVEAVIFAVAYFILIKKK